MVAAWTPEPDHTVTEIYVSADNSKVALVIDEAEDILLFDAELEGPPESITMVEDGYRRVWP